CQRHHVLEDRVRPPSTLAESFVKYLTLAVALLAGTQNEGELAGGRLVRADAGELVAFEHCLDRRETDLFKLDLSHTIADSEVFRALRVAHYPVRIGALDAEHPARVFGLTAVEESGCGARTTILQVGCFQRMEIRTLGICDLGLSTKGKALHRDAVRRIHVRTDDNRAGLVQHFKRMQHVRGGSDLATSLVDLLFRNMERQQ